MGNFSLLPFQPNKYSYIIYFTQLVVSRLLGSGPTSHFNNDVFSHQPYELSLINLTHAFHEKPSSHFKEDLNGNNNH